ncbi:MAG: RIP metalloprotease RseP [Proteobacteria bacterium]|nr:MAG: RIP metalloprotease RseP [Pseudomonadota bacterium]
MHLLTTVVAFVVALGTLIVVHELGHYLVARLCGVKVLRFSVGFGRPLFSRRVGRDRTEWSVAAFPLGGYVKMLDEREGEVAPEELPRAFNRQPVHKRFAVVLAGPLANFLLAIFVYWLLFMHGVPGLKPMLAAPEKNTPAAHAELQNGELILAVAGRPVSTWQDLRWELLEHAVEKDTVTLEVQNERGEIAFRKLDLSGLSAKDLDADFLAKVGLARWNPPIAPIINTVTPDGAGQRAGLMPGDEVLSVLGNPITRWDEFVAQVRSHADTPLPLTVRRGGRELALSVTPTAAKEGSETVGKIGVGVKVDEHAYDKLVVEVRYGPFGALSQALGRTWDTSALTLKMLGKMVMGQVSIKNLSGPITIADYAGQSAQMGWLAYISFIALISISLGVLNLLPVPVLDGGHLMYYIAEIIRGRPISDRALEIGQRVGMVVLFSLMAFAIYNDIYRLVGG